MVDQLKWIQYRNLIRWNINFGNVQYGKYRGNILFKV